MKDAGTKAEAARTAKNLCTRRFKEWWDLQDMVQVISELKMGYDILLQLKSHGERRLDADSVADILYDVVGPRFLRSIGDDKDARRKFLLIIIATGVDKKLFTEKQILDAAVASAPPGTIKYMNDVINLRPTQKWCLRLAEILKLPSAVAERERAEEPPSVEIVEPHIPMNPLYDYQYSTGAYVRAMLEGKSGEGGSIIKRKLIAVPTGSGKTRMITETLVEWLNDGKPSRNEQQSNSRFVLWVAQSHELCEQARTTFKDVFQSFGKQGTLMRLYKFWGHENALPDLQIEDLLDERGIIVASIQSLHSIYKTKPQELELLSRYVSCIVVDEAHHSIAPSYASVLRTMGFNWTNRKKEISERGIILLGLTATPFRGAGEAETKRLLRWYNGVHFPSIKYVDDIHDAKPHALIDCPTVAYARDPVRMLGEKSYDVDGQIVEHTWYIKDRPLYHTKNASHKFKKPGEYVIGLNVRDNDGNEASSNCTITILPQEGEDIADEERQRDLYSKLIQRRVLCEVYHRVIVYRKAIDITMKDASDIENYGEFQAKTLRQVGELFERNSMLLQEIRNMWKLGRKKILFFGCTVEHSRKIAIALQALYGIKTRYVDSIMDLDSRIAAIQEFRNGDVEVLCNFGVLTTGFDAPGIDCVFIGRPVRSALLYTQMIGRGMRGTRNGGTDDMVIVDVDDNFQINNIKYTPITDSLGWKIYREYWKAWQDPQAIQDEDEDDGGDDFSDIVHVCVQCGREAAGPGKIKEIFGFECPDEMLAEMCRDGGRGLPSVCGMCRGAS